MIVAATVAGISIGRKCVVSGSSITEALGNSRLIFLAAPRRNVSDDSPRITSIGTDNWRRSDHTEAGVSSKILDSQAFE